MISSEFELIDNLVSAERMMTTQGKSLGWHIKHEPLTTLTFFLALLSPWAGLVIGASANMSDVMIVTLAVSFLAVFLVLLLCSFFVEVKRDISPKTRSAARFCLLGIMSLLAVGAVVHDFDREQCSAFSCRR